MIILDLVMFVALVFMMANLYGCTTVVTVDCVGVNDNEAEIRR